MAMDDRDATYLAYISTILQGQALIMTALADVVGSVDPNGRDVLKALLDRAESFNKGAEELLELIGGGE